MDKPTRPNVAQILIEFNFWRTRLDQTTLASEKLYIQGMLDALGWILTGQRDSDRIPDLSESGESDADSAAK